MGEAKGRLEDVEDCQTQAARFTRTFSANQSGGNRSLTD
jgi:hypothetical protein